MTQRALLGFEGDGLQLVRRWTQKLRAFYSCRRATIGSMREALRAGRNKRWDAISASRSDSALESLKRLANFKKVRLRCIMTKTPQAKAAQPGLSSSSS